MVDTFTPTPVKDIEPVSYSLPHICKSSRGSSHNTDAQAYQTVKSTFLTGKTRSLAWRKQQLYQLGFLIVRVPIAAQIPYPLTSRSAARERGSHH